MKIKRIIYITNDRIPTERARGLATIKICEAFCQEKVKVELICPNRLNRIKKDVFFYYQVAKIFKIKRIPSIDLMPLFPGAFGFWIQYLSFVFFAAVYLLLRGAVFKKDLIFFSHDHLPLFFLSFFTKNVYYDVHRVLADSPYYRLFLSRLQGLTTTNRTMREELIRTLQIQPEKIFYVPNGVDLSQFIIPLSKTECRQKLGLPEQKKLIIYVGQLFDWNFLGAKVLAEASRYLTEDCLVLFVGGIEKDVKRFTAQYAGPNIKIKGLKPHAEIPLWLRAADVLVLPNTAQDKFSKYYTSPIKMFEYMASQRPIVASDLPSIRDILSEENAVLVEPDNPEKLAQALKYILHSPSLADKISKQALRDVQDYTWQKRAQKIISFAENL